MGSLFDSEVCYRNGKSVYTIFGSESLLYCSINVFEISSSTGMTLVLYSEISCIGNSKLLKYMYVSLFDWMPTGCQFHWIEVILSNGKWLLCCILKCSVTKIVQRGNIAVDSTVKL